MMLREVFPSPAAGLGTNRSHVPVTIQPATVYSGHHSRASQKLNKPQASTRDKSDVVKGTAKLPPDLRKAMANKASPPLLLLFLVLGDPNPLLYLVELALNGNALADERAAAGFELRYALFRRRLDDLCLFLLNIIRTRGGER